MTLVVAPADAPPAIYGGLATRTLAFAMDAAVVNLVVWFVGAVVALALSVIGLPEQVRTILVAIGAALAFMWLLAYFAFFWSTTGQTPGNRVMRIRVRRSRSDQPLAVRWAVLRLAGLALAAIPLLLGFVPILLTDRRRGLQDLLGRSVVVGAPEAGSAEPGGQVRSPSTS